MAGKKISQSDIIGQQGVSLISVVVSEMGYLWHQSVGPEAGIDGIVEIRDPGTGEVTNCIVQVQSKATSRSFQGETEAGFDFLCDERDLNYWMSGNAPVILVVSRPATREAYWIDVKTYFRDPSIRKERRVHFRKKEDRFDVAAAARLAEAALPRSAGLYLASVPKPEPVVTNLLPVTEYPARLHHAATHLKDGAAVRTALAEAGARNVNAWLVHGKFVLAFEDLSAHHWRDICDLGTHEEFDSNEWAESDDPDRRRAFVQLLNSALRDRLHRDRIFFDKTRRRYYFGAHGGGCRTYTYLSSSQKTTREVVSLRWSKKVPKHIIYFRHSAFEGQFLRHDMRWYLEIIPTYAYTSDGRTPSRFEMEALAGIKRLELNDAVLGQLVMWAGILGRPARDLFSSSMISFGRLVELTAPAGIVDEEWLPRSVEATGSPVGENLTLLEP